MSGAIVAGRAVRLTCARHLRDLDRQGTADFPYVFDVERVEDLNAFFSAFLTLDDVDRDGRNLPFRLVRWLQFCWGSLVGWVHRDTGHRRFKQAFIETGKGSTKTPGMAGLGVYGFVGENRTAVQVYSLGVNGDQAGYLFNFAKRMCERSEDLRDLLDVGGYNIAWVDRSSFFRPLTSEGRSLDNKLVFLALIDELQEHPSGVIPEKMRLGIKNQVDGLIVECCNSGYDKTSVAWRHHDLSMKILEGTIIDEEWFAYICMLDPCEACRETGATQPNNGCPNCDNWQDETVWPKVAPALGEVTTYDYLRSCVRQAINQPEMLARVKRLNFCCWTEGHSIWIPSDQWEACRDRTGTVGTRRGVPTAVMFDMSMKSDLTGCVVAQRIDDPKDVVADQIELKENDSGAPIAKKWSVNYTIDLTAYAWLPRDTLLDRVRNEHIPYDLWERLEHLRVTPGPVIDHHLIEEEFLSEIGPTFQPQRVAYDPFNATELAVALRDRGKYTVVEIKQGRGLSEFVKLFHALVRLRRIRHNGNPVFAWCISNAEPKYDRYENVWLEKSNPTKRIDLAIAAIGAVSQVVVLPTETKLYQLYVFGGRRGW